MMNIIVVELFRSFEINYVVNFHLIMFWLWNVN